MPVLAGITAKTTEHTIRMSTSNGQPKVRIDFAKAKKREKITTTVEWKNGILLEVNYLQRPAMQKMYDNSQVLKMDEVEKIRKQVSDPAKFGELFCKEVMVGWGGLTVEKLADILPIDPAAFPDQNAPVEFTMELAISIYVEGFGMDTFLQPFVTELRNFRPQKEHEEGNSESSPSGS